MVALTLVEQAQAPSQPLDIVQPHPSIQRQMHVDQQHPQAEITAKSDNHKVNEHVPDRNTRSTNLAYYRK